MCDAVMLSWGYSRRYFWLGLLQAVGLAGLFLPGIPFRPPGPASHSAAHAALPIYVRCCDAQLGLLAKILLARASPGCRARGLVPRRHSVRPARSGFPLGSTRRSSDLCAML